MNSSEKNYYFK